MPVAAKRIPKPKPLRKLLVLAEKPIQGREIASAIVSSGWIRETSAQTNAVLLRKPDALLLVTWAEGHLMEMLRPDDLNPNWGSPWNAAVLPMIPPGKWIDQRPKVGAEVRVRELGRWFRESEEIINACDAGPEGELIFDELLRCFGMDQDNQTKQLVSRMWISDTRAEGLLRAFEDRSRSNLVKYCHLREGAWARSQADWLFGFNLTRMATLTFKRPELPLAIVGRVQTPTLGAVAELDKKIATFESQKFNLVPMRFRGESGNDFKAFLVAFPHLRFGNVDYHFHPVPELYDQRQELLSTMTVPWTVTDIPQELNEYPPPPFDLLDLQRSANRIHGWSAAHTLAVAQSLYAREKCITYPRTASSKIPPEMRDEVLTVRERIYYEWAVPKYPELKGAILVAEEMHWEKPDGDHHAILPTGAVPRAWDESNNLRDEYRLWQLIAVRTILAWLPPAKVAAVKRHLMRPWGNSNTMVMRAFSEAEPVDDPGWLWWEERMMNTRGYGKPLAERMREVAMPDAGEFAKLLDVTVTYGSTACPKPMDESTLLGWMGRNKLGTPATRHQIIEDLILHGYLQRESTGTLLTTLSGRTLIALLEDRLEGEVSGVTSARQMEEFIQRIAGMARERPDREKLWDALAARLASWKRKLVGSTTTTAESEDAFCPRSGAKVTLHSSGKYYEFAGFKDARCWLVMFQRQMSAADYATIFAGGDRGGGPFENFVGRTGSKFNAFLAWRPKKKKFELVFKR